MEDILQKKSTVRLKSSLHKERASRCISNMYLMVVERHDTQFSIPLLMVLYTP